MLDCDGKRWCEIWWMTLTWNVAENVDVECSRERRCWNMVNNCDVEYGG